MISFYLFRKIICLLFYISFYNLNNSSECGYYDNYSSLNIFLDKIINT